MLESDLFLGFPIDSIYQKKLDLAEPRILKNFISDEFLQQVTHEGMAYLGKPVGKMSSLSTLDLVEKNIFSLLKNIVPDFPYHETPLYLFPYQE